MSSRADLVAVLLVVSSAAILRLINLDHTAHYDEFFHFLAARSFNASGDFCIAECVREYDRGALFTVLVAWTTRLLGDSVEVARLPSVIAGSLTVLAVFLWLRRYTSLGSATGAAVLCAIAPELIAWSQNARFYALHAFLIAAAAFLLFAALVEEGRHTPRVLMAAIAVGLLGLAYSLQVTTLIAVFGMALWGFGWFLWRRRALPSRVRALVWCVTLAILAVTVVGAVTGWPRFLRVHWEMYRQATNLMLLGQRENIFFYHAWFSWMYGALYALFPAAALVALARRPLPSSYALTILVVGFLAHSFGGFKGERLIIYLMPFCFVIWGIVLSQALPALRGAVQSVLAPFYDLARWRGARAGSWLLVVLALAFLAGNTEAFQTTVRLVTLSDAQWTRRPWLRGHSDWELVRDSVAPLMSESDVVLSSASVKAIYFLDRLDAEINRTQLFELDGSFLSDFTPDWRTGRPVVSQPRSISSIMDCHSSGLVLAELGHWRDEAAVPPETADLIEDRMERIPLPRGSKMLAFRWTSPDAGACENDPLTRRP